MDKVWGREHLSQEMTREIDEINYIDVIGI